MASIEKVQQANALTDAATREPLETLWSRAVYQAKTADPPATIGSVSLKLVTTDRRALKFFAECRIRRSDGVESAAAISSPSGKIKEFANIDDAVRLVQRVCNVGKVAVTVDDLPVKASATVPTPQEAATRDRDLWTARRAKYQAAETASAAKVAAMQAENWQTGTPEQQARYKDESAAKDALTTAKTAADWWIAQANAVLSGA